MRVSDLFGGSLARYFRAHSAAGHHHFRGERHDCADRAADREPECGEQYRGDRRIAQRPDKQGEDRRTGGSGRDSTEHDCGVEGNRAATQSQQLPSETLALSVSACSIALVICSTRSATRARRVANTFSNVAMPESRKIGVSATWMIWATRSSDETGVE